VITSHLLKETCFTGEILSKCNIKNEKCENEMVFLRVSIATSKKTELQKLLDLYSWFGK
jgi:hypothetical protein